MKHCEQQQKTQTLEKCIKNVGSVAKQCTITTSFITYFTWNDHALHNTFTNAQFSSCQTNLLTE